MGGDGDGYDEKMGQTAVMTMMVVVVMMMRTTTTFERNVRCYPSLEIDPSNKWIVNFRDICVDLGEGLGRDRLNCCRVL